MFMIYSFVMIFFVFMGVFFITLMERKILGIIQFRYGPNKVGIKGSVQSLSDAIKLMTKSIINLLGFSWIEYNFMPSGMLILMIFLWLFSSMNMSIFINSLLIILCIFSLSVYPIMYGGYFSGSFYSMLGSLRSIAQMISYEVSLIIIFISIFMLEETFSLGDLLGSGFNMMFFWLMLMLFVSLMIEMNRSPFDLVEGESELVSGFNTEYYGFKFALIFLAEYGMIMYMSGLFIYVIMGVEFFSFIWSIFSIMVMVMIIWFRGVYPRIRYDTLMFMCWVIMLNFSLGVFSFMLGVYLIIH